MEPRGTYFIARISPGSLILMNLILNTIWFPWVPLEITVRNKVPSGNILVGTSFIS
jgi:hypothetical protein